MVTLRGCGQRIDVPTFESLHGLRPCMVGPTAIIRGVTMTFGMSVVESEGATGYYDSNLDGNLDGKMTAMAGAISNYDFGFVHVKGVDDAGHDKSFDIKHE